MAKANIYDVVSKASKIMVDMQRQLSDVGLYRSAAKVNAASQELGWEAAERFDKMEAAERRKRVSTQSRDQ